MVMSGVSRGLIVSTALLVCSSPALGQTVVRLPGEDSGVIQFIVAAGLVFIVTVAGFVNAKRSHQN